MALVWNQQVFTLEACEHYQKGSYRNRCHIAGPNGVQRLSLPLAQGKHQQTPIREVRLAYDLPWQKLHWRSIRTAYGNAPYFEHYVDELAPFFEKRFPFLFDYNLELLRFIFQKIGYAGEIHFTHTYKLKSEASSNDFRDVVSPKNTAPPSWFQAAPYPQVFTERHGFLGDLSVLDLLFCCGKQGGVVLERSKKQ